MADLGRKWSEFRYHGNKVRPIENRNSTIKSAVHENPLFGANSAALALVQAALLLIWVENGRIYVTMATRVDPVKIWMAPLNRPSRKPPVWCKLGGSSISTSRVIADLGRKWSKFQNSISQRIFNRSSPVFYPHWFLAVAIQWHCWNYLATSRFGQTENFGSISSLTWRSRSRSTETRSARWRPMGSIPTKFHQNPIISDKVIWILSFRLSGQKWDSDLEKWVKVAESGSMYLGPLGVHTSICVMFVR